MPALNYDRVWRGGCNECGDCGGAGGYYQCGLLPMARAHLGAHGTCGRGCGEVYWGEWVSDPPDCCDPCNSCGDWQNQQCCSPGLMRRLWWGAHGYRLGGPHGDANCCGGCNGCGGGGPIHSGGYVGGGGGGCSTCGHGHGDAIHHGPVGGGNILNENWENEPIPTSDQPIHNARQPVPARSAARMPSRPAAPVAQRSMGPQQRPTMAPTPTRTARPVAAPRTTTQATSAPRSPRPWSPVASNPMREQMR